MIFKQSYTINLLTRNLVAKSENSSALKNSIAYSETLKAKTICSIEDEYQRSCTVMKQTFLM